MGRGPGTSVATGLGAASGTVGPGSRVGPDDSGRKNGEVSLGDDKGGSVGNGVGASEPQAALRKMRPTTSWKASSGGH